MTEHRTSAPSERADSWPESCADAQAAVFRLRRNGLPLLPGITADLWAASILAWSTGRTVRCVGLVEVAA